MAVSDRLVTFLKRGLFCSSRTLQIKQKSHFEKCFGDTPRAPENTNRWRMLIPAFSTHVCLGAPYGWSAISGQLTREMGIVSSASSDWTIDQATWPMAVMIASGGLSAALLGPWTAEAGVRRSVATGGVLFGSGLAISGLGVATHSLALLYSGNVMCGLGYGCAYTPPLQAMLNWFPDKRGLASGLVIAGFGSGALAFTPAVNSLSALFCHLPTYLGPNIVTSLSTSGSMLAEVQGHIVEVVHCTAGEMSKLPYSDLAEGYYLANTGDTGVSSSLTVMALAYSSVIVTSAFNLALPPNGYSVLPSAAEPFVPGKQGLNVPPENLLATPQFWLLFSTATLLATGGMAIMSVARPMIQEVFTPALPSLVTPAFASLYLMSLSVANLSGRVFWAAISDWLGCRTTFNILCISSIPLFLSIPQFITGCVGDPSSPLAPYYLGGFCVSSFLTVSIMGGVFSVLPPYEADLYGSKYVGAIHGRFLPFSTLRGIAGPAILLHLRSQEEREALQKLLAEVDPEAFKISFGADKSQASVLLDTQSLTLSKLAAILPQNTLDPSTMLYNSSMHTMAVLAMVATILHLTIKPVHPRHFEKCHK